MNNKYAELMRDAAEKLSTAYWNSPVITELRAAAAEMEQQEPVEEIESLRRERDRLRDGLCRTLLAVDDGQMNRASNIIMRVLKGDQNELLD